MYRPRPSPACPRPRPAAATALALLAALALAGCGGDDATPAAVDPDGPITLAGSVTVAGATAVDGDVNDLDAPYGPNDTAATAQPIPNPVSLGGYVNLPRAGPDGRSAIIGDEADFFSVDLEAGQVVTLTVVAVTTGGDVTLRVHDAPGDASPVTVTGAGPSRSWTVPAAGEYLLEVQARTGAARYLLSIGQAVPTAPVAVTAPATTRLADDFVPGEIVLRWREGVADIPRAGTRSPRIGLRMAAGAPGRAMLARLEDETDVERAYAALGVPPANALQRRALAGLGPTERRKWHTLRVVAALRRHPDVAYAGPNHRFHPLLAPDDLRYPLQWHYPLINLPQAWDLTTGASPEPVVVAVIDTGIVSAHPDLQGQIAGGYDFVREDGGIDPDPEDPGGDLPAGSFHGTHVAGTVGAATNNGTGVAGVAWQARLLPLRAMTATGGSEYDIMQAVRYAAGLRNDVDRRDLAAPRADVINLSLGGTGYSDAFQNLVHAVRARGVIVVAAAGNAASSAVVYPAAYDGVVAVSAVDAAKALAPYSSYGATVDVAAPGGDLGRDLDGDGRADGVLSTFASLSGGVAQPNYAYAAGTSMAAPHVAGVVALMRAVDPTLTPERFDQLLASGEITVDLGAAGRDPLYGHGLIDAFRAVAAAGPQDPDAPPVLAAAPTALNLGSVQSSALLTLRNAGGGTLTVTGIGDDVSGAADWLRVEPESRDPSTWLGSYRVTVTRSGLPDGTYSGNLAFSWRDDQGRTGTPLQVPVIMQVASNSREDDAGVHYVLLLDPDTGETLAAQSVAAAGGRYAFRFEGVPRGSYLIVAGSDPDNDGAICADAEACGGFRTLDRLEVVQASGDRPALDFVTGFASAIDGSAFAPAVAGSGIPLPR